MKERYKEYNREKNVQMRVIQRQDLNLSQCALQQGKYSCSNRKSELLCGL
jgi:hypothetical protein